METRSFGGVIGRYHWESEPWWPPPDRAPDGAPNVLVVLLDDVGFAQLGCFGSDIETPRCDRLARDGLRFVNFHTTALCSPTRACVLTGRNHHSSGIGRIVDLATGFPGYNGRVPRANAMLPAMLTPHGYAAYAVGKWHLTPEEEYHAGATRARWPLGRGFERWYGFFGGETSQFAPALVHDNHPVAPPASYQDGYHLTEDLADRAIGYVRDLRNADPDKPFFLYFATGACHSPHQAPREWLDRYRGHFDRGWDVWREETFARQQAMAFFPEGTELSPRPEWVPPWESLSDDGRAVYARYMEAFAAFLSHTDHQIGRILDFLETTGDLDETLVLLMSDNGASSEGGPYGSLNDVRAWNVLPRTVDEARARLDEIGGPTIHNNYPWGWTVAGNTPFRRWKRETHEGGVADPLIVSWPRRVPADGELRRQYVHAIDVVPTVLEVLGVDPPTEVDGVEQRPIEGTSFAAALTDADAPDRHETQYYEMLGCRALYHRGWKAVVYHPIQDDRPGLDSAGWELYHVAEDPSECRDLAAEHPDLLEEMVERWWVEAEKHQVLPLDNRAFSEFTLGRPSSVRERSRYVYHPDGAPVPESVAVSVKNRDHTVIAEVETPEGGAQGALLVQGSILGGWSLHLLDDRLVYVHNLSGLRQHRVEAPVRLGPGAHTLGFRFTKTGGHAGTGELLVDGAVAAVGEIDQFTPTRFSLTGHGLTCGYAEGLPPCDDYRSPFRFSGVLHRVVVDVDGRQHRDPEGEAAVAVATQ